MDNKILGKVEKNAYLCSVERGRAVTDDAHHRSAPQYMKTNSSNPIAISALAEKSFSLLGVDFKLYLMKRGRVLVMAEIPEGEFGAPAYESWVSRSEKAFRALAPDSSAAGDPYMSDGNAQGVYYREFLMMSKLPY